MHLSLIVALDRNGLIGRDNQLPWRLPADLRHFKEVTMGKPVIMGRRTCESIGRPLPGRRNIVLTRDAGFQPEGFDIFHDADSVLGALSDVEESVVIGGSEIYRVFWPSVARAYVTLVEGVFEGDAWFPEWPLEGWRLVASRSREPDDKNPYPLQFKVYEKVEND